VYYLTLQNILLLLFSAALSVSEKLCYHNFESPQKVVSKLSEDSLLIGRHDNGCDVERDLNFIPKMQNVLTF